MFDLPLPALVGYDEIPTAELSTGARRLIAAAHDATLALASAASGSARRAAAGRRRRRVDPPAAHLPVVVTVGDFRDAAGRALAAAGAHGDHPVEDARELAETLAAARLLFTALAAELRYAAGPGARYQPWGAAVAELAELLPRTPSLIAAADPARAQHPLARSYLAAAAAVGLERDLLPAIPERVHADARGWLLRDTLDRTTAAAGTLQLLADRIRQLHAGTAQQVAAYAADVARTAAAARPRPPRPGRRGRSAPARRQHPAGTDPRADPRPAGAAAPRARPGCSSRPARVDRTTPPDRGALRGYSQVLDGRCRHGGRHARPGRRARRRRYAAGWRAAGEPWRRLQSELTNVATLGRRNPAVEATAADAVAKLDMLRQLPSPAPASQRDRLLSDAAATGLVLRELSVQQRRLVDTLVRAGELYSPARLLSENDARRR